MKKAMEQREQITKVEKGLLVLAPAKINLSLLVDGVRDDGFHEIHTVISKVNFYDELLIEEGAKKGIELICEGPRWAPEGKDNLIYQACEVLFEHCGIKADIKITLCKNIPAGSGLGSASSDAAATLIGVNQLLGLGVNRQELIEIGNRLGSDVAFFFGGPLSLCTGRGEKVKKISEIFNFLAVLVLPDVSICTKMVYESYKGDEEHFEQLRREINRYVEKNRIDFVAKMCTNMLEKSCFSINKGLSELKRRLERQFARSCCLSGSGSSMYCIFEHGDIKKASEWRSQISERIGCESIIVNNNRW